MLRKLKFFALCASFAITGLLAASPQAHAQDCMMGEITMFAGTFAPRGYAFAEGQLISIGSNTALFSLLGTVYGGDGQTTFALPDLRGRAPVHPGQGPGLSNHNLGQTYGAESVNVTLSPENAPPHVHSIGSHSHNVNAVSAGGTLTSPTGNLLADDGNDRIYANAAPDTTLSGSMIADGGGGPTESTGNGTPFSVATVSPRLGINYIICMVGIFPSRS